MPHTASIVDVASGKVRSHGDRGKGAGRGPAAARWCGGVGDRRDRPQPDAASTPKPAKSWASVNVGKRPRDLAFTPDGKRAYVTSEVGGTVWVIDVPTEKAIKVIELPKDSKPMGVVVSPDAKRVFVANGRGGTVSVIDAATNAVVSTIPVGQRPWGIALTLGRKKLYTANGPSNDVSRAGHREDAGGEEDSGREDSLGRGHRLHGDSGS